MGIASSNAWLICGGLVLTGLIIAVGLVLTIKGGYHKSPKKKRRGRFMLPFPGND